VGTSGTAKALTQIAAGAFGQPELTRESLERMAVELVRAVTPTRSSSKGCAATAARCLPGGLAVMTAVFDELGVESLRYCAGRCARVCCTTCSGATPAPTCARSPSPGWCVRYGLDPQHGERVARTAQAMHSQAARGVAERIDADRALLGWAAELAEIGMSISHEDFHKHSSYILSNADMPGFSQTEQDRMARLALGQGGGLRKMRNSLQSPKTG
jgi:exopolyphosphatase/guanosine-5'-triphosphate,3'-diphosphate pyrophosphatase